MNKKKPTPPNEKKLRRKLSELTEQVRAFLAVMDRYMLEPPTVERGRKVADLCNQMNLYNDGIRYFWCGVDYRKDRPCRALELAPAVDAVDPHLQSEGKRSTRV